MRTQAILFDLDGTLLDTTLDIAGATNRTLRRFGYPEKTLDFFPLAVGDGARMLIRRCLEHQDHTEQTADDILAEFLTDYTENLAVATHPYPAIRELLDHLRERGVRMAVLSNKPDAMTKHLVRDLLGNGLFEVVVGTTPEFPRKPDPASALDIARRMGVPPRDFLYVGDTGTDMQTAVGAGMLPVGALWGFRDADELGQNGAQHLITLPGQLLELV